MSQEQRRERVPSKWERGWREVMASWRASGQTQVEFCRSRGLSASSFSHWKAKLAARDRVERESLVPPKPLVRGDAGSPPEGMSWTEVHVPAVGSSGAPLVSPEGSGLEVVFPQGWSVRLGPRFEAEALRRLLNVLEERSC
jgi:hypothetical protein